MLNSMKSHWQRLSVEVRNAEFVTENLRAQQQQSERQVNNNFFVNQVPQGLGFRPNMQGTKSHTRLHMHSSSNGMNFGGFNNHSYGDEQLLDGLGDEPRLF